MFVRDVLPPSSRQKSEYVTVNDGLENALTETDTYSYNDISFKSPAGNEKENTKFISRSSRSPAPNSQQSRRYMNQLCYQPRCSFSSTSFPTKYMNGFLVSLLTATCATHVVSHSNYLARSKSYEILLCVMVLFLSGLNILFFF
jgi:hypothetical protein